LPSPQPYRRFHHGKSCATRIVSSICSERRSRQGELRYHTTYLRRLVGPCSRATGQERRACRSRAAPCVCSDLASFESQDMSGHRRQSPGPCVAASELAGRTSASCRLESAGAGQEMKATANSARCSYDRHCSKSLNRWQEWQGLDLRPLGALSSVTGACCGGTSGWLHVKPVSGAASHFLP
jgi:hypothetical protein